MAAMYAMRKGGPDPKKKGMTATISATRGGTQKKFIAGDMQGKHIVDRVTTPETGKSLGEHPAKTQTRMNAQASGKTSYSHGSKQEYSGRREHSSKPEFSAKISGKAHIPKLTPSVTPQPMKKKMKQTSGTPMKRRLPRVDYLQGKGYGRNKRTESGY